MSEEDLSKVHVDLPNHWATGGESLWAESLGSDLYRVRNVPFHAYGLNFGDVVRATSDSPDLIPEIREIITPSGHKTLRLYFEETVEAAKQHEMLIGLHRYKASYERATDTYVAIDVEPDGNYDETRNQPQSWENSGLLNYETCEARIPNSFDDRPDAD